MTTGDIAAILTIVVMIGAVLVAGKDGFMEKLRLWLKPKKCPKCGAGEVLKIEYGYPIEDLEERTDVYWGGCCMLIPANEWHCKKCRWEWGKKSEGCYCQDDVE